MRSSVNKKSLRFRVVIFAVALVIVAGLIAIAGCSSYGYAPTIPSDHFEATGTLDSGHTRCGGCHEGTSGAFSVDSTDSYSAHLEAWDTYQADLEIEESAKQLLADNQEDMEKYFALATASNCMSCHDTSIEQSGVVIGEINTNEFCMECHSEESIVAVTAEWDETIGANPHESHVNADQDLNCSSCHQFHSSADVLYCNECHEFELDEGWISPPTASAEDAANKDAATQGDRV